MLQNHPPPPSIHPSPARLGLTTNPNPNSPSLPNPTPPRAALSSSAPTHHHPHTQTLTTAASASPALLPLLPPLARAQSLLLHLASLASRLFDVSPHRPFFLSSFRGSLPSFLPSSSDPTPPPSLPLPSSTKEILSLSTALQTQLFESVAQLQEILDLQNAHLRLSGQIRSLDSSLLSFAQKLHCAQAHLSLLVDDYSDQYPRPNKRLKSAADGPGGSSEEPSSFASFVDPDLKLSDILSYAHRISYTTFAPPEFGAGQAPLRGALPPAPQEEQLRASQLYKAADLDLGLPAEEADTSAIERLIDTAVAPPATTPMNASLMVDLPAAIRGMAIPPIPSGWRPGMPIELPTEFPIPPPGWKPGDPVALPPLDSRVTGPAVPLISNVGAEEQRLPAAAAAQQKAPEPIQVRYVQLDINPDQDEYSSDYSSDEGSSEEEDED